jgi:ferredoxin
MWTAIAALTAATIVWPVPMAPQADPLRLPEQVMADLLFGFWMPISRRLPGGHSLLMAVVIGTLLVSVPWVAARRGAAPPASRVDEDICVGCVQCSLDCPYGAITMVPRDSKRSPLVARVDPALCVSCGICSGSCPPMGVGPPGRTGRDQLVRARTFISAEKLAGQIVAVACGRGAGVYADALEQGGARPYGVSCAGNLHSSVVELLLRGGASGVLILSCPPRDCSNREGPRWLGDRIYHGREAELHDRVNRARIRVVAVNAAERAEALAALAAFAAALATLEPPVALDDAEVSTECVPVAVGDEA